MQPRAAVFTNPQATNCRQQLSPLIPSEITSSHSTAAAWHEFRFLLLPVVKGT